MPKFKSIHFNKNIKDKKWYKAVSENVFAKKLPPQ